MHIITPRLNLIPYQSDMVTKQHVAWLNDKDVVKFSEQRYLMHNLSSQKAYVYSSPNRDRLIWLIRLNGDDIGTIAAHHDAFNVLWDMGILIGEKSMWGKGYGLEAWQAVMDWLFKERKARKIEAGVMLGNTAMTAICIKSRMRNEGVRPDHFLLDGHPRALLMYGKVA